VGAQQILGGLLIVVSAFLGIAGAFSGICCGASMILFIIGLVLFVTEKPEAPRPLHWSAMPPQYPYGAPPWPMPAPPPPRLPFCTHCAAPSMWVPQYARYYCPNCRRWLPASIPPPGIFQ